MKSNTINKTIVAVLLLGFFLLAGYWLSDDWYYSKLISDNNLETPKDVFDWTIKKFDHRAVRYVHHFVSPRHLIDKHKSLYCDEGAIVMAALDHKLGYKTRLVDLYGYDNIAHHTILQVFENGNWVNCDFTFRLYNQSLIESSDSNKMKLKKGIVKPYPRFYNFLVNNNFFLKKIALKLRGINENKEPNN